MELTEPIGILADRAQRQDLRELLDEAHIATDPPRLGLRRAGVVVVTVGLELRRIGVGVADDLADAGDAGDLATAVGEEELVARLHLQQEVAGGVVAHAVPRELLPLGPRQVVYRKFFWFPFHQPMAHPQILPYRPSRARNRSKDLPN